MTLSQFVAVFNAHRRTAPKDDDAPVKTEITKDDQDIIERLSQHGRDNG